MIGHRTTTADGEDSLNCVEAAGFAGDRAAALKLRRENAGASARFNAHQATVAEMAAVIKAATPAIMASTAWRTASDAQSLSETSFALVWSSLRGRSGGQSPPRWPTGGARCRRGKE